MLVTYLHRSGQRPADRPCSVETGIWGHCETVGYPSYANDPIRQGCIVKRLVRTKESNAEQQVPIPWVQRGKGTRVSIPAKSIAGWIDGESPNVGAKPTIQPVSASYPRLSL